MTTKIGIKINTELGSTQSKLKGVESSFSALGKASLSTTSKLGSFYTKTKKVNMELTNLSKDANRAASSFSSLGTSGSKLNQVLGMASATALASVFAKVTQSAMNMIETINLFNVAMGKSVYTANDWVTSMHGAFNFDTTNIQNAVGTFGLLSKSMGMSSKNSETLATNTAKLAYDLSSLTNVPINQVMQDLRSGLVGQSETMYKYGVDVTEASLKQEALNQGIATSVRNMSQGEKMALRYATMLRQTSLAHGDFARTINTPANQLKILSEQFVTLSRTIGSIFVPMLTSILPYINAVMIVLIKLSASIAAFFGFVAPAVAPIKATFSGVEDGADAATDATNGTAKALKKLKSVTMGFDELNIIPDQTDSSAGSAGAGAGGGIGTMPDLTGYDNLMSTINSKAQELAKNMEEPVKRTLKTVGLIGLGIAGWKLSKTLAAGLQNIIDTKKKLDDAKNVSGKTSKLPAFIGNGSAYVKPLTAALFVIGEIAAAFVIMTARFTDLYIKSENFRLGLSKCKEIANAVGIEISKFGTWFSNIKLPDWAVLIPLKTLLQELQGFFKDLNIDASDVGLTLAGIGLLFTPAGVLGAALLVFEGLTLAVRAFGYAASDVVTPIDIFANDISDATKTKMQPFIDQTDALSNKLNALEFTGTIIKQSTVDDVKTKAHTIAETILDELSSDRNQDLANLNSLSKYMNSADYLKLLVGTEAYYANQTAQVQINEDRINEILEKSKGKQLSNADQKELVELQKKQQDIGVKQLSATEIEYETIMNRLHDNSVALSVDQASKLLLDAKKTKEGSVTAAEEKYAGIELAAQRMVGVNGFTQKMADDEIAAAKKQKDEAIRIAAEKFDGINSTTRNKLGENSKNIDTNTQEIKSKWQVFWDETLSGTDTNAGKMTNSLVTHNGKNKEAFTKSFSEIKTSIGTWWDNYNKQQDEKAAENKKKLDEKLEAIKLGFTTKYDEIKTSISTWWDNYNKQQDIKSAENKVAWDKFWGGLKDTAKGAANSVITFSEGMINGLITGINHCISKLNGLVTKANKILSTLKLPTISFSIEPLPKVTLPRLATGGILSAGQTFEAGEMGKAEMIGNYNGKTTVMPLENTSFVSAIHDAVLSAMTASQQSSDSTITVVVPLDGEVIYKNQQKVSRNRGLDMGMGAFAR